MSSPCHHFCETPGMSPDVFEACLRATFCSAVTSKQWIVLWIIYMPDAPCYIVSDVASNGWNTHTRQPLIGHIWFQG